MVKKKKTIFIAGSAIICIVTVLLLYFLLIAFGVIQIRSNKLIIKANDITKEYDGIEAVVDSYTIMEGTLDKTHTIVPTYSGTLTDAGTKEVIFSVQILDENNTDVTSKYQLELQNAIITINKRELEIKTLSQEKQFDGTPLVYQHYEVTSGSVISGHTLEVNMPSSITNYGKIVNECVAVIFDSDNKEVTKNYNIKYNKGFLEIIQRKLVLQTNSLEKTYDGLPLEDNNYIIKEGYLREGDRIECKFKGSITDVGSTENLIYDIRIYDSNNADVTEKYHIETEIGTLTVKKNPLIIQSESLTKIYDKLPLQSDIKDVNSYTVIGNIAPGHTLTVKLNNSITEIGSIENTIIAYIKDSKGIDVTDKYELELKPGTLKVLPYIGGSGDITSKPISPQGILFCQVKSPIDKRLYLRDKSYGNYNKGAWDEANVYQDAHLSPLAYSSSAIEKEIRNGNKYIKDYEVNFNMIEKNLANFSLYNCFGQRAESTGDVKLDYGRSDSFSLRFYDYNIFQNEILTVDGKHTRDELKYREYVHNNYLYLSDDIKPVLENFANEFAIEKTGDTLRDIIYLKYLVKSSFQYGDDFILSDDSLSEEEQVDPMGTFISYSRIGNCQHFASAATLLYRYLGIPARYVTGYVVDCKANQYTNVTDEAGHAWTEIYIDGYGWVNIETTSNIKEENEQVIINVTTNSSVKEYDGLPLTSEDYSIDVMYGELNPKWNLDIKVMGSQTEPGSCTNKGVFTKATDENGKDISNKLIIFFRNGTLTVEKIKLTISTETARKQYDGTPLINHEYTIKGNVIHNIIVTVTGTQTEVGESPNFFETRITDDNGKDVSGYYDIQNFPGNLEVYNEEHPLMKVTADKAGSYYLRDESYGNYDGRVFRNDIRPYNYKLPINPLDFVSSYLQDINQESSTLTIEPLTKGLPFFTPYYRKDIDTMNKIHNDNCYGGMLDRTYYIDYYDFDALNSPNAKVSEKYSDAEKQYRDYVYKTYLTLPDSTKIKLEQIAKENNLDKNSKTLIDDVKKYIRTAAEYDDKFAFPACEDAVVEFLTTIKRGVCRHYAAAATAMYRTLGIPARYVTGFRADIVSPKVPEELKVGHAWVEVYIDGLGWVPVEVTGSKRGGEGGMGDGEFGEGDFNDEEVVFKPKDVEKQYTEGMDPIKPETIEKNKTILLLESIGYTFKYDLNGSLARPGKAKSTIENVQIFNKEGNDVTKNFRVVTKSGLIHVYLEVITFKTKDIEMIYDGEIYTPDDSDCTYKGHLANPNHSMEFKLRPFKQKVGIFKLRPQVIIKDGGRDITDFYKLKYEGGNVKITPRLIEIEAKSAQKSYDGTPLVCNKYEIIGGDGLLPNNKIIITITGKQIDYGISSNVITKVKIIDIKGKDVTSNYTFKTINGQLIVMP